ncbi:hypothetical protein FQR65_LT05501 [Abscondita terminalis]|nr:hypothetical protein FQR65_LT05501 [Abscondita terminalis]
MQIWLPTQFLQLRKKESAEMLINALRDFSGENGDDVGPMDDICYNIKQTSEIATDKTVSHLRLSWEVMGGLHQARYVQSATHFQCTFADEVQNDLRSIMTEDNYVVGKTPCLEQLEDTLKVARETTCLKLLILTTGGNQETWPRLEPQFVIDVILEDQNFLVRQRGSQCQIRGGDYYNEDVRLSCTCFVLIETV